MAGDELNGGGVGLFGSHIDVALPQLNPQADWLRCAERVHGALRSHRTHPWMRLLDERLRPGAPGPQGVELMLMLIEVAARAALTSQVLSDWPRRAAISSARALSDSG